MSHESSLSYVVSAMSSQGLYLRIYNFSSLTKLIIQRHKDDNIYNDGYENINTDKKL